MIRITKHSHGRKIRLMVDQLLEKTGIDFKDGGGVP
jgi:hypothetical protein